VALAQGSAKADWKRWDFSWRFKVDRPIYMERSGESFR